MTITEEFLVSDYTVYEQAQSRLNPSKLTAPKMVGITCPICGHVNRPIGHCMSRHCDGTKCRILLSVAGNSLTVTGEVSEHKND